MHHVMDYGCHCALVGCACIFQHEKHHSVVKISYGCSEGNFLYIPCGHSNLIIFVEFVIKENMAFPAAKSISMSIVMPQFD